jgi:hypothetical protein
MRGARGTAARIPQCADRPGRAAAGDPAAAIQRPAARTAYGRFAGAESGPGVASTTGARACLVLRGRAGPDTPTAPHRSSRRSSSRESTRGCSATHARTRARHPAGPSPLPRGPAPPPWPDLDPIHRGAAGSRARSLPSLPGPRTETTPQDAHSRARRRPGTQRARRAAPRRPAALEIVGDVLAKRINRLPHLPEPVELHERGDVGFHDRAQFQPRRLHGGEPTNANGPPEGGPFTYI